MTDFIPGVNILVGVAEDSLAAWQAANLVSSGSREMEMLAGNLDRQIAAANRQLMLLGMKRAEILTRLGTISRTA